METISKGIWRWIDIAKDLEQQGGLKNVTIFSSSFNENRCAGKTENNTIFCMTWSIGNFLTLHISQKDSELIKAISKVLNYQPCCKYTIITSIPRRRARSLAVKTTVFRWIKNNSQKTKSLEGLRKNIRIKNFCLI
ncbi:hypothetical protein ACFL2R_00080 [Patescibacteria group bacterium]